VKDTKRKDGFQILKRGRRLLLWIAAWLAVLPGPAGIFAGSSSPPVLPPADRTLGGALFRDAYRNLNEGRLAEALRVLQESLRYDPYLVDFYLLRGYISSLLGDVEQANKDFKRYLEVRPGDPIGRGLQAALEKRVRFVRNSLREGPPAEIVLSEISSMRTDLGPGASALRLPIRPFWNQGLLAFGDAATGQFWVFQTQGGKWDRVFRGKLEKKLVRVLPGWDGTLLFVFSDGRAVQAGLKKRAIEILGQWKSPAAAISDAVWLAPGMLVVSDRLQRTIRALDSKNGKTVWEWKLPAPFGEPVCLSASGNILAIADRKGKEVFLLDVAERLLRARIPVPGHPRALEWANSGLLLVLSEEGELLALSKEGSKKVRIGLLFPEAWFLFREGMNRFGVADTRFMRHARFEAFSKEGFLSLRVTAPREETSSPDSRKGSYGLKARVLRPLDDGTRPEMILAGVLNGRSVEMAISEKAGGISLPAAGPDWDRPESFESLRKTDGLLLRTSWIPLKPEVLCRIGDFALANSVALHILADTGPCPRELVRLAEMTGGRVVFSNEEAKRLEGAGILELNPKKATIGVPSLGEQEGIVVLGREGRRILEGNLPFWEGFLLPF